MFVSVLTIVHTLISLIAIASGAVAVAGLFRGGAFRRATDVFLASAVATSLTGFLFPLNGLTPAVVTGLLALGILSFVLMALYLFHLAGAWRWIFALGMVASLYLLVFVGVAQAFQQIEFLNSLAPSQSEAPFLGAQLVTLLMFVVIGILARRSYYPGSGSPHMHREKA
jgi:endonuclease/exonuclease/phosphatase (EEP) superfamily protein YafD